MLCEDIRKEIKPFLEDMLKEETYQEFLEHVEQCSKCKTYVTSLDSFSNQLWKLGEVDVPSDFSSTVLFKLKQPVEESEQEEGVEMPLSKKLMIGSGVLALVGLTVFFIVSFLKIRESSEKDIRVARAPVVTQTPFEEPAADRAFEGDSADSEPEGYEEPGQDNDIQIFFSDEDTAYDDQPAAAQPNLLHWHYYHYDKAGESEVYRLERKQRNIESKLKRNKTELEHLKNQPESAQRTEELQQQESAIKELEEENRQIKTNLDGILKNKTHRQQEPQDTLKKLNIRPDYQDNDFLLFTATGDQVKSLTDEIARLIKGASPLKDFTTASYLSNKPYRVSVYLEKKSTSIEHWHVHLAMHEQKTQFLNMVRERGGAVTYEYEDEVTFSIFKSAIEKIKAQMPAMRMRHTEFGNVISAQSTQSTQSFESVQSEGGEEGDDAAAPVVAGTRAVITVYFTK